MSWPENVKKRVYNLALTYTRLLTLLCDMSKEDPKLYETAMTYYKCVMQTAWNESINDEDFKKKEKRFIAIMLDFSLKKFAKDFNDENDNDHHEENDQDLTKLIVP